MYHIVCPTKYRRIVLTEDVDHVLQEICLDISLRYEISFLEIGTDLDHVHFLVQSVPAYSPSKIVRTIKSITAREIFSRVPEVKKKLWGGQFWSKGYWLDTVGRRANEKTISNYVKNQGNKEYKKLYQKKPKDFGQMSFWDED